jgi:CheY-like chemotaxis protein
VYSLVRQHGGWIDVLSEVGAGTTFTAFLPAVERAVAEAPESMTLQPSPETLPKVKILAVEDDVAIQTMLKAIFEKYEVPCTVVRDGASALTEWHCAGPFDLVVTDVVMPGNISGVELARRLRALSPTLPIVFITGYSPEHVADEKIEIPGPPPRIALKPFTVASLSEAMLGVLGPNPPERR